MEKRTRRTPSEIRITELPKTSDVVDKKTVVVMVGLPARGKSYIVKMLHRYLNWVGYNTRAFNAGDYRRSLGHEAESSQFFDPDKPMYTLLRQNFASMALDALFLFLKGDGDVGIFDATNTTRERRQYVIERCAHANLDVLFIESVCDDPELLSKNYSMKLKSPDYRGQDPDTARADFQKRVEQYQKVYVALDRQNDRKQSFIKLYNVGQYLEANKCNGVLESEVICYLLNAHIQPRRIWLCLHGETDFTVKGVLGGDPILNENGRMFSKALYEFIAQQEKEDITILCDTSQRVYETVRPLRDEFNIEFCSLLRELNGGDFDQMTYDDIRTQFPQEYERRERNKLSYRYPGGESYLDVKDRCYRILMKIIGSRDNILVVGHTAMMRVIMAYFLDIPGNDIPNTKVEMHTIYELEPTAYCTNYLTHKLL